MPALTSCAGGSADSVSATGAVRVETIASWSFGLIRHYPLLSGLIVGADPDWTQSCQYYGGAAATIQAEAIRRVMQASYSMVIVDEYQDCVAEQHGLILALHDCLPVCVFGDPLQNIFDFGHNVTVKWAKEVAATWPALDLPVNPWRWQGHHEELGQWLIDIRPNLYNGTPIDLAAAPLTWRRNDTPMAGVECLFRPACWRRPGCSYRPVGARVRDSSLQDQWLIQHDGGARR